MTYRYFDNPRAALALMRAESIPDMAAAARPVGIDVNVCAEDKRVRETMYATAQIASLMARRLAVATNKTFNEVMDELTVEIELSIPAAHEENPE
jgi:hypothetical protein